jgi:hypothetical protein
MNDTMLVMFEQGYARMLAINAELEALDDASTEVCLAALARFDVCEKHAWDLLARDETGRRGFSPQKIEALAACIAQRRAQLADDDAIPDQDE